MRDTAFLESVTNLKALLRAMHGRTPSTTVSTGIAVSLQQGRLFYRAADDAPIEIRPLVVFYGTMAYAKAIVAAKRLIRPMDLNRGHGLKLIPESATSLVASRVSIQANGTFPEFVDAVSNESGLRYFNEATVAETIPCPTTSAAAINGLEISLEQVLARMPRLRGGFRDTFKKPPSVLDIEIKPSYSHANRWKLKVHLGEPHSDRESLEALLDWLHARFPILSGWSLLEADCSFRESELHYENLDPTVRPASLDQVSPLRFTGTPTGRQLYVPVASMLAPLAYGDDLLPYLVEQINGHHVSVHALGYLGAFVLSMLVRYYPDTWVHIVRRSVLGNKPADDAALSLVERFMEDHRVMMQRLVEQTFYPHS